MLKARALSAKGSKIFRDLQGKISNWLTLFARDVINDNFRIFGNNLITRSHPGSSHCRRKT
jgi:hypothetical protein